ncbi:MAG: DUF3164 family protein [Flavobacteriaceae bacterium]|nr:DUF3164 family protein [Flavobacteriaceae bacterium]
MDNAITLDKLTPEQRAQLAAEYQAEQEAAKKKQANDRVAYKQLSTEMVPPIFSILEKQSEQLAVTKQRVFEAARDLIKMKEDAYGVKEGQQSHTFSNEKGTQSITIGYRVVDGWDDTLPAGMEKVKKFIEGRAKDKYTQELVDGINLLLKKDKNGNLKSSRILELQQWASKIGNSLLMDGVAIIMDAYKPVKTCYFIDARFVDGTGKMQSLPLSISAVDFPMGTEINFL